MQLGQSISKFSLSAHVSGLRLGLGLILFGSILGCSDNSVKTQTSQSNQSTAERAQIDPSVTTDSPTGKRMDLPTSPPLAPAIQHQNLAVGAQLLTSGQFADAEIVLRTILKEQPDCARAEFLLGVALMKQKQYAKARPLLEESLARNQDFSGRKQVDHFLGWTCFYVGDLESAKRYFQSHVGAVPTADDSYYGLAVIAIDEDRISDAQVALERAMDLIGANPARKQDRAKVLARLGDIELRRDKVDQALSLYEEASEIWPDHYEVWGKLSRVYDSLNRPLDAEHARAQQKSAMQRIGRAPLQESLP